MIKKFKSGDKIGIIFSGGPAPSANAVISSCALTFLNAGHQVIGFYKGYEYLQNYDLHNPYSLVENYHFKKLGIEQTKSRNLKGVILKTSRANPGRYIKAKEDLQNPEKTKPLMNILNALQTLGVGCLISIGGDDTLKTANYLRLLGLPVIHIPKTIDNDYYGIPWTYGYWTAVDVAGQAIQNITADAQATETYFIIELMGRKAGWITYAGGIMGEAVKMYSSEDFEKQLDLDKFAEEIVDIIILRERVFKPYGVICISEGLADKLPPELKPKEKDRHGNIIFGKVELCKMLADRVEFKYKQKTGREKKVKGKQIGYETRCAQPISFDVILGSMLGFGSYKIFSQKLFGHMVSVSNNFDITAIPFDDIIDAKTLLTKLRNVPNGSDFYNLKEALSFKLMD